MYEAIPKDSGSSICDDDQTKSSESTGSESGMSIPSNIPPPARGHIIALEQQWESKIKKKGEQSEATGSTSTSKSTASKVTSALKNLICSEKSKHQ